MSLNKSALQRTKELNGLCSSGLKYFESGQRNLIGLIDTQPLTNSGKTSAGVGKVRKKREIFYYTLDDDIEITDEGTQALCALGLHNLYMGGIELAKEDPNLDYMVSGILTILSAFCSAKDTSDTGLYRAGKEYDITLKTKQFTTQEELIRHAKEIYPDCFNLKSIHGPIIKHPDMY